MSAWKSMAGTSKQMDHFPTEWAPCCDDSQIRRIVPSREPDSRQNTPAVAVPDSPPPDRPTVRTVGVGTES
jgi:hypothetical protein